MNRRARHIQCTLEEYHQREEWSHSQSEDARKSWLLFHGKHIAHIYPPKRTSALDTGSVAHLLSSHPGSIDELVAVIPPDVLNKDGHRKGAAWLRWKAEHAGKILMTKRELAPVQQMVRNVYDHPDARALLDTTLLHEFSLVYEHPDTGLPLRSRPDLLTARQGAMMLAEIKTTSKTYTPRSFVQDVLGYGYHRQIAWQWDAVELFGYEVVGAQFVTISSSPAYECRVFELPTRAIQLGREENGEILRELARRLEADDWSDVFRGVIKTDLPEWAYERAGLPAVVICDGDTVVV